VTQISASARTYLRPVQFADTPVNRDGEVARLAGGMQWFAAYELIAVEGGRRGGADHRPCRRAGLAGRKPAAGRGVARPGRAHLRAAHAAELGERRLRFDSPQVMGILNLTPDSFSDGGKHLDDPAAAAAAGVDMGVAGAAIVDVGGGIDPAQRGRRVGRR
jgi:dihydropteroate synthase